MHGLPFVVCAQETRNPHTKQLTCDRLFIGPSDNELYTHVLQWDENERDDFLGWNRGESFFEHDFGNAVSFTGKTAHYVFTFIRMLADEKCVDTLEGTKPKLSGLWQPRHQYSLDTRGLITWRDDEHEYHATLVPSKRHAYTEIRSMADWMKADLRCKCLRYIDSWKLRDDSNQESYRMRGVPAKLLHYCSLCMYRIQKLPRIQL